MKLQTTHMCISEQLKESYMYSQQQQKKTTYNENEIVALAQHTVARSGIHTL